MSRILFLESVAGVAGDMFAAAFVDAGLVPMAELAAIPAKLGLAGEPWRAMLLTRFDAQQVTAMIGAGAVRYFATSNPGKVFTLGRSAVGEGTI